jgi:hypothetical protein
MALQVNKETTNVGVAAPTAYARIMTLTFDAVSGAVSVAVNIYYDEAARDQELVPVEGQVFTGIPGVNMPSIDGSIPGVRAAMYMWLKTLPYFAGAVDV